MAKDQKFDIGNLFKNKINRLFLVGMGVLLLVRLFMFSQESSYSNVNPDPPAPVDLKHVIAADSPEFQNVAQMINEWPELAQNQKVFELTRQNMFDPQRVIDAVEIERQANDKYGQADAAFRNGNLEEARRLAQECLSIIGNHKFAKELIKKIDEQTGAQAPGEEGDSPTTATNPVTPPAG